MTETTETQEVTVSNRRGEVGTATSAQTVKKLWKQTCFLRSGNEYTHKSPYTSLKRFARELVRTGNEAAQMWLASKKGKFNDQRSEANVKRIQVEKQATKNSRKKNGAKSSAPKVETAVK